MKIAFFLTGHGFGHGVRNSAIIEKLPENIDVEIYTSLPESFFREELDRPYTLIPCEIDCGCLQTNTVEVDILATLNRYFEIDANRDTLITKFSKQLLANGVDLIIGDIPPLTFPIARAAGIKAISSCNFDWVDIYHPFIDAYPIFRPLLQRMIQDYKMADQQIRFTPYMDSHSENDFNKVGLICRPGKSQRQKFAEKFGLDIQKKWCLIYVGSFGLDGVAWEKLSAYTDWEFIGLYPLHGAGENYHPIQKDLTFRYADLTASVDLVLGKLGYGLVAECISLGKPILFLGRNGFSEFSMLKNYIEARGQGLEISLEEFMQVNLQPALKILTDTPVQPVPALGVSQIFEKIGVSPG